MHCIWLTIKSPDLSKIIFSLSQKYGVPIFQPHCTLLGRTEISIVELKSAIVNLVTNHKFPILHPTEICSSNDYWRALYIELNEKQLITSWHKYICSLLAIKEDDHFLPHISLMYNHLPMAEKKILSKKIQVSPEYEIKSINIMECSEDVNNWNSVFAISI